MAFDVDKAARTMLAAIVVCVLMLFFGAFVTMMYHVMGMYILIPVAILVSSFVIGGLT
jgi:hypothetical protein